MKDKQDSESVCVRACVWHEASALLTERTAHQISVTATTWIKSSQALTEREGERGRGREREGEREREREILANDTPLVYKPL